MQPITLGDVRIDRLLELEGIGYEPTFFFPDADMDGFAAEMDWLAPHFWDVEANTYIRSIQSYLVRTPHHTILVDACVGDGKDRPSTPAWDGMKSTWMDQLTALGVGPKDIDFVLCTHLHADHVGWNTRLENDRWVPTFPNAKYVIHQDEFAFWEAGGDELEGPGSSDLSFEDSVLPVVAAGQSVLVDTDYAVDDAFTLLPTPGHSPGHMCIDIKNGGGHAIVSGDAIHHPIQVAHPEWNSRFCFDAEHSRATRKRFVEANADRDTLILAAHFPTPTAGRIVGNGARCKFQI